MEKPYNSGMKSNHALSHKTGLTLRGLLILSVVFLLSGWLINTPPGLLGKADAVGYAVCHRIDVRSFHLGERQIPLCARCSGMYLGAVLGLGLQAWLRPRRAGSPSWRVLIGLGLLAATFAVDGLNSYLHLIPGAPRLYEPQNWLRLFTGSGMGLALAGMLYPAFNQTIWARSDPRPALDSLRTLGGLVQLAGLLNLLVLTENPLLLYPLALISAAGVLLVLTMVYSLVWLMLARAEQSLENISQAWLPLLGGFGLALLQIAALDWVRYLLTGTWNGFSFG
jgi:uncharacterized membrane protein